MSNHIALQANDVLQAGDERKLANDGWLYINHHFYGCKVSDFPNNEFRRYSPPEDRNSKDRLIGRFETLIKGDLCKSVDNSEFWTEINEAWIGGSPCKLDRGRNLEFKRVNGEPAPAVNAIQHGGDHYKRKAIQPLDYIAANNIGFFEGSAIKYLTRWKEKNGVEDLKKAVHFIQKLIEIESNCGQNNEKTPS